jgi:hypothetical protein
VCCCALAAEKYASLMFCDVFGIWLAAALATIVSVMYGFALTPLVLKLPLIAVLLISSLHKLWNATNARSRAMAFAILGLTRLGLNLYRLVVVYVFTGGVTADEVATTPWWEPTHAAGAFLFVLGDAFNIVGGAINVLRFPEKHLLARGILLPWIDFFGNSHQLMHVLTGIAIAFAYAAAMADCVHVVENAHLTSVAMSQLNWLVPFA